MFNLNKAVKAIKEPSIKTTEELLLSYEKEVAALGRDRYKNEVLFHGSSKDYENSIDDNRFAALSLDSDPDDELEAMKQMMLGTKK